MKQKRSKRRKAPGKRHCCPTGKVCFRDKLEAMIALSNTRRSDSERRREKRFYKCEYGDHWHLTSQEL